MSAYVQVCQGCLASYFPKRLICPACSSTRFNTGSIDSGSVETTTILADGTQLATIVGGEPKVYFIARMVGGHTRVGALVPLTNEATMDPDVAAFVPLGQQLRGES